MTDFRMLDNPIWFALTSAHASIARSSGLARRYPSDVSPLAAVREATPAAFSDLRGLVPIGENVGLFTAGPIDIPETWQIVRSRLIDQMVCERPNGSSPATLLHLKESDVPEMLALTAATEPGPFLPNTIRMGQYLGIRSDEGRLIAMAGQRLRLDAFTEISAVCTDPSFRGLGHARSLLLSLASQALADGKTPFLHVKSENAAKFLYEKVGFRFRHAIQLNVITPRD